MFLHCFLIHFGGWFLFSWCFFFWCGLWPLKLQLTELPVKKSTASPSISQSSLKAPKSGLPCIHACRGMPPKADVRHCQLLQVFQDHRTQLERMTWKHMDPEELAGAFLGLMKSLAKVSYELPKASLRAAVKATRMAMTPAEQELLALKLRSSFTWVRKRLRDAGSGKFLPSQVVAIARVWKGTGKEKKSTEKRNTAPRRRRTKEGDGSWGVWIQGCSSDELRLFGLPEKPSGPNIGIGSSDGLDDDSRLSKFLLVLLPPQQCILVPGGMSSSQDFLSFAYRGALQQEAYITILDFSMILLVGTHA